MRERELRWHDLIENYWDGVCSMSCVHPAPSGSRYEEAFPWEEEIQKALSYIPFTSNPDTDRIRISTRMRDLTEDEVLSVCFIRVIDGTWFDNDGYYLISLIARAWNCRGTRMGFFALRDALKVIRENSGKTGRPPVVFAHVDHRNKPSLRLFEEIGFLQQEEAGLIEGRYLTFEFDLNRTKIPTHCPFAGESA